MKILQLAAILIALVFFSCESHETSNFSDLEEINMESFSLNFVKGNLNSDNILFLKAHRYDNSIINQLRDNILNECERVIETKVAQYSKSSKEFTIRATPCYNKYKATVIRAYEDYVLCLLGSGEMEEIGCVGSAGQDIFNAERDYEKCIEENY